jgi:hypothetical protein
MAFSIAQALLLVAMAAAIAWITITVMKTIDILVDDAVKRHFEEVYELEKEIEEQWESEAGDPILIADPRFP